MLINKTTLRDKLYYEAIEKLSEANEEKITKANPSLNNSYLDYVQSIIDKGIEIETPKLKDDEILSVHINKVKGADNLTYLKIDVLRVKRRVNNV